MFKNPQEIAVAPTVIGLWVISSCALCNCDVKPHHQLRTGRKEGRTGFLVIASGSGSRARLDQSDLWGSLSSAGIPSPSTVRMV